MAPTRSSGLSGLGIADDPLKVFAHTSIDIKNLPENIINPIDRLVALLERVEVNAIVKLENLVQLYERPFKFLMYSLGASMMIVSSSLLINAFYNVKKKDKKGE